MHTVPMQVSPAEHGSPSSQVAPSTGAQSPFVGAPAATLHASQGPAAQALVQHTPSARKPVRHWLALPATWPAGFLGWQMPAPQYAVVDMQSASTLQLAWQTPPTQGAGLQSMMSEATQVPPPSQRSGGVKVLP